MSALLLPLFLSLGFSSKAEHQESLAPRSLDLDELSVLFERKAPGGNFSRSLWADPIEDFDALDRNHDGTLTLPEFLESMKHLTTQKRPALVESESQVTFSGSCWKRSSITQKTTATCPSGKYYEDGLCYNACPAGWSKVVTTCYAPCPAGWKDIGLLCTKDPQVVNANTAACPWYNACCLFDLKGRSKCPDASWINDGCTCRKTQQTQAKQSMSRGVGTIPNVCPSGYNLVVLGPVCQTNCPAGQDLVAGVCWQRCGNSTDCGGVCTDNVASCNVLLSSVAGGSLSILAGAAATIGTAGAALAGGVVSIAAGVASLSASLSLPLCG